MAIKRREIVTYRDDRGCDHDLAEMDTTHIINVIRHHLGQVEALRRVSDRVPQDSFMGAWINGIEESITLLALELAGRNPAEENGDEC
jgi:hypothetical protein